MLAEPKFIPTADWLDGLFPKTQPHSHVKVGVDNHAELINIPVQPEALLGGLPKCRVHGCTEIPSYAYRRGTKSKDDRRITFVVEKSRPADYVACRKHGWIMWLEDYYIKGYFSPKNRQNRTVDLFIDYSNSFHFVDEAMARTAHADFVKTSNNMKTESASPHTAGEGERRKIMRLDDTADGCVATSATSSASAIILS